MENLKKEAAPGAHLVKCSHLGASYASSLRLSTMMPKLKYITAQN